MAWTNLTFNFGAVLTSTQMTQLYDNFAAMAAGSGGAPSIVYGAMSFSNNIVAGDIAASAVGASEIAAGAVGASEIGSDAVHQAEVFTASQDVTRATDGTTYFTATGGAYTLGHTLAIAVAGGGIVDLGRGSANVQTSHIARWHLTTSGISNTVTGRLHYIAASKPYDMGDGEIPIFIYALIDNATQEIISVSTSFDPPWAYNGPTKTTADRHGKDGKQYINQLILPPELSHRPEAGAPLIAFRRAMAEFKRTPDIIEEVELTPLMKNTDWGLIPDPFIGNDLTDKTVVLFDPVSSLIEELSLLRDDGESINTLFHNGYINIGNTPLPRKGPEGLMIVSADWKVTA